MCNIGRWCSFDEVSIVESVLGDEGGVVLVMHRTIFPSYEVSRLVDLGIRSEDVEIAQRLVLRRG